MGVKQGPMTLEDVETLLVEATKLSNHRNFIVAGSLSVLGAVMRPPQDMLMSRDVAIAKLARSEENDMRWVTAGVKAGIIHLDIVEDRLKATHNILKGELKKIRSSIRSIHGMDPDV